MNRPDISRLRKNRAIFLKVGFLVSISFVIMAFNVTVYEYENDAYTTVIEDPHIFEEVIRTKQPEKKKLPPVNLKTSEKFIDENQEFKEDPLPKKVDTEVKIDTQQLRPVLPKIIKERPKPPVIIEPVDKGNEPPPIFTVVEEMPRFPGCEDAEMTKDEKEACAEKALLKYIYSNIRYPKMASSTGIEGTTVVQFVINKKGEISDLEIAKDIGGGCGNEVVRIVKAMPDWIPGKQLNRPVNVRYMLPVKFKLQ